ncbi:MAG: hypothetical protein HDS75_08740 [Bacteroidales bacterium]|nr:hypothetical protein [Bacteroidales bacterium]
MGYTLKSHYTFQLSHSLFSEKPAFQEVKVTFNYTNAWQDLSYSAAAYGSSTWNGDYKTAGARIGGRYTFAKRFHILGILNPHYDTGYDYNTCFAAGASVNFISAIALRLQYTTIPDYRMSEKRLHAGFDAKVGPLSVSPILSVPLEGSSQLSKFRVLASCSYTF